MGVISEHGQLVLPNAPQVPKLADFIVATNLRVQVVGDTCFRVPVLCHDFGWIHAETWNA